MMESPVVCERASEENYVYDIDYNSDTKGSLEIYVDAGELFDKITKMLGFERLER